MKRWGKLGWAVGAAVILGGALTLYSLVSDPFFHRRPFRSEDWIRGDERLRGQMVKSLMDQKLLEGKKKSQVLALLGPGRSGVTNHAEYSVDIGARFGGSPWSYMLVIEFDATNELVRNIVLMD